MLLLTCTFFGVGVVADAGGGGGGGLERRGCGKLNFV